jgi:hypothetical protein
VDRLVIAVVMWTTPTLAIWTPRRIAFTVSTMNGKMLTMTDQPNVRLQRSGNLVEIIHTQTHAVLAWCFIGDEDNVERIADILSAKRLGAAAQELREMARQDRLAANHKPPGVERALPAGMEPLKKPPEKAAWLKAIFG